jgi:hypothetical protein
VYGGETVRLWPEGFSDAGRTDGRTEIQRFDKSDFRKKFILPGFHHFD